MRDPFGLFLFETAEADLGDGGAAEVADVADVAPEAVDPEAAPEAPGFDFTSPAFRDAVAAEAEQIADARLNNWLEEISATAGQGDTSQPGQPVAFDPFDPESVAQFLASQNERLLEQVDQRIQQIQAPLQARAEQETIQRGEENIRDIIADDIARNGDLPARAQGAIRPLADIFFDDAARRYGNGPRAAEAATLQAAAFVREIVAEARQDAVAQEANRLSTLAGARTEPGSGTSGVVTLPEVPLDNRSLALKYAPQRAS